MEALTDLSAGLRFTCALDRDGKVVCWGINEEGQIAGTGEGGLPREVEGLGGKVREIASGESHTCAWLGSGAIACWGANDHGQLGDGKGEMPIRMTALPKGTAQLEVGKTQSCAISEAGAVTCWGEPGEVTAPWSGEVTDVAPGWNHTCALLESGEVSCFGSGANSQMGIKVDYQETPMIIAGLPDVVVDIVAGEAGTLALSPEGAVYYWGYCDWYLQMEFGDPIEEDPPPPALIPDLGPVIALGIGAGLTCVLTGTGEIRCLNHREDFSTMTLVPSGETRFSSFSVGAGHLCAIDAAGGAWCWGSNSHGQLGNGEVCEDTGCDASFNVSMTPVQGLESGLKGIAAGDMHSCALTAEGEAYCWGNNYSGQVGSGDSALILEPVAAADPGEPLTTISAGNVYTGAITQSGEVALWGKFDSRLGPDVLGYESRPVQVRPFPE